MGPAVQKVLTLMDQNQGQRRSHFHRGRRGPDRRGTDRRSQPQPQPQQDRGGRDQVDVEQIMREIRGRIAQRQGIDLSNQQIQDLAARRLESILDPRAIKPSLLDALRRSAGAQAQRAAERIPNEPVYSFEDTTIYDSHRGLMRFIRRLLNPLLKLFFNPNPLIRALHLQAKLNVEAAEREAERDRRQTEWNALHYEIVQRLVTEVSRASLDLQALSQRVESLDAKVDFNERRVRGLEGSLHRTERRPQNAGSRPPDQVAAAAPPETEGAPAESIGSAVDGQGSSAESARRRRRRRRGRKSGPGGPGDGGTMSVTARPDAPPPVPEPTPAMAAAAEQLPDTGIAEAPPVPFQHDTPMAVPFEHPVPTPMQAAPPVAPPASNAAPPEVPPTVSDDSPPEPPAGIPEPERRDD
jgi:hypothetical protein